MRLPEVQLADLILKLRKPNPPATDVRHFVQLCHNIASAYLNQRVNSGRLDPVFFAVSVNDLAMDCIAGLFERNRVGEFPKIKAYFKPINTDEFSEEALLIYTRRLVFSAINDELFRLYKIEDPSLGNIIRCIKSALKYVPDLFSERVDGEIWLYVEENNYQRPELPLIPHDYLYLLLSNRFSSTSPIRQLIREFTNILKTQRHYRRRYPLTGLAYLIRVMHTSLADTELASTFPADAVLRDEELRRIIKECSNAVKQRMQHHYVVRNKFSQSMYENLFPAIERILEAQYVENDGFDRSFFEYVKMHNPRISPTKYSEKYRKYFEYLVKMSREELIKKIIKDFS